MRMKRGDKKVKSTISPKRFFEQKNRKGLSGIVTALILIVLVLVAAGIVWAVYNSLIKGSAEDTEFSSKCLGVSLDVTSLICDTTGCNAMITRGDSSNQNFSGFEYSFVNSTEGTDYSDSSGNLAVKKSVNTDYMKKETGNVGATQFFMKIYFNKENGDKYYCTPIVYKK